MLPDHVVRLPGLGRCHLREVLGRLQISSDGREWADAGPAHTADPEVISAEAMAEARMGAAALLAEAEALAEQRDGYRLKTIALLQAFRTWVSNQNYETYIEAVKKIADP